MSNFAPVYIIQQAFLRVWDFLYHWYAEGTRFLWNRCLLMFHNLEQPLAFRITIRHLIEPLYKDYTVVGWILGPIFRVGRVLVGAIIYFFLFGFFFALIAAWVALPIFIVVNIIHPFVW